MQGAYSAVAFNTPTELEGRGFTPGNAVMLPLRPLPPPIGGNGGNADPEGWLCLVDGLDRLACPKPFVHKS